MAIIANDWVGNEISLSGFYEQRYLAVVFEYLKPHQSRFKNGIAIDVGANIGNHSIFFAPYFQQIVAFEPGELARRLLKVNAALAGNIEVHGAALGSSSGQFVLHETEGNAGASRLKPLDPRRDDDKPVEVMKLDSVDFKGRNVELLKIDVEGAELDVLQGALYLLREQRPVVLFEQLNAQFNASGGETPTIELLRNEGYEIYWLDRLSEVGGFATRTLNRVVETLTGHRRIAVLTGDQVPPADHSMLLGIPADAVIKHGP